MTSFIIYKVTNLVNRKLYVGQTIQGVTFRWRAHVTDAKGGHGCRALGRAIRKYGESSFAVEIIEECSSIEELNKREEFWILRLMTLHPHGYNLREGGHNRRATAITRRRISKAKRGIKQSAETIEKRFANIKGQKRDAYTKALMTFTKCLMPHPFRGKLFPRKAPYPIGIKRPQSVIDKVVRCKRRKALQRAALAVAHRATHARRNRFVVKRSLFGRAQTPEHREHRMAVTRRAWLFEACCAVTPLLKGSS